MPLTRAIVDRLTGSFTTAPTTICAGSYMAGARDINEILPAVVAIPSGAQLSGGGPHDGRAQKDTVTFFIVLIMPFVGDDENEIYPEDAAEQYIVDIKAAMIGWRPETGYQPWAYAGELEPDYDPAGFVKFTITFDSGRITIGTG